MDVRCLSCGKKIDQTPGKKPKQFCNVNCRSRHWQQNKKAEKTIAGMHPATKLFAQASGILPVTYPEYKKMISEARSISDCEATVERAKADSGLADWQRRQIESDGIKKSQEFDF